MVSDNIPNSPHHGAAKTRLCAARGSNQMSPCGRKLTMPRAPQLRRSWVPGRSVSIPLRCERSRRPRCGPKPSVSASRLGYLLAPGAASVTLMLIHAR